MFFVAALADVNCAQRTIFAFYVVTALCNVTTDAMIDSFHNSSFFPSLHILCKNYLP